VVDLVAVGHVTLDRTATGVRPGGAAYYAAATAHRLGLRVGLLTAFGADFPREELPAQAEIVNVGSARTTVFEVADAPGVRALRLITRAEDLSAAHLPPEWRAAPLALLCPVADEVDPHLAASFAEGALGVVPQGWMRRREADGAVAPRPWENPRGVLVRAQSLVMSDEDVEPFKRTALEWFQGVPLGALTHGRDGATLFVNGEPYHVVADTAKEISAIGAGDVFATAFLIEYQRRADPWEAAAAASCVAAASVESEGVAGIPDREGLERRMTAYRRRRGG
jgi:1D-myo-inositol 3-kinase